MLDEGATASNWSDQLICHPTKLSVQSRCRLGIGTLARPFAYFDPQYWDSWVSVGIARFGVTLPKYADSISSAQKEYTFQMKAWLAGGVPDQARLIKAREILYKFYGGFHLLVKGRQLGWQAVEQRYHALIPLLHLWETIDLPREDRSVALLGVSVPQTDLPDFQLFKKAYQTIDEWSWIRRLQEKIGAFPITEFHLLIDNLRSQIKPSVDIQNCWEVFFEKVDVALNQGQLNPSILHRALVTALYYSGKVEKDEVATCWYELVLWFDSLFHPSVLHQEDFIWQTQLTKDGVVFESHVVTLGDFILEVDGCRLYETAEEAQILVAWKNPFSLSFLKRRSLFTEQLIDPTGVSCRVCRSFSLASPEGKDCLDEMLLISALQNFLSENSLPQSDLVQAGRVEVGGRLFWIKNDDGKVLFDPIAVENFLIRLSPNKSHDWMQRSGIGATEAAISRRGVIYQWLSGEGLGHCLEGPVMVGQLVRHAQRIAESMGNIPLEAVVNRLKAKVIHRWLSDKGLIATFTDSFLAQFDQEIKEEILLTPSSVVSSQSLRMIPSTPIKSRMGLFD